MLERKIATIGSADGRFDHIKCPVCAFPWQSHELECARHAHRPEWAKWLHRNPDPRSTPCCRAAVDTMLSEVSAFADLESWMEAARAAGVPERIVEARD